MQFPSNLDMKYNRLKYYLQIINIYLYILYNRSGQYLWRYKANINSSIILLFEQRFFTRQTYIDIVHQISRMYRYKIVLKLRTT